MERVRGLRERQEADAVKASVRGDSGGCSGCFEIPRSRRAGRQQAARFAFFAALVPACGRVWNLARRSADRDAKIEPAARKMTDARRSHLMHPMNQVHKMTDSR